MGSMVTVGVGPHPPALPVGPGDGGDTVSLQGT